MHLTHHMLVKLYETLLVTPPFKGWKLPPADDVEFHATTISGNAQGEYYFKNRHVIRVSPARHKTLAAALATLAHEVCHLREYELGSRRTGCHGAVFKKLANEVCKHHGFDRGQF